MAFMTETPPLVSPDKAELYRNALEMLNRSGVPYLVGGTYAFQYYAGISRTTKDFKEVSCTSNVEGFVFPVKTRG